MELYLIPLLKLNNKKMAKKKQDSSFYNKKYALLREYGIDAQPEKDLVTVGLTFNENHLKAIAEEKGMTAGDFEASIDALAHEEDGAERPGVAKKEVADPAATEEDKSSTKKATAPRKPATKKVEVVDPIKEDTKVAEKSNVKPEDPTS